MITYRQRSRRQRSGWILAFALGVISFVVMLLALVWINIQRVDTSYYITRERAEISERRDHLAKLEVERERLLTPHELKQKALRYGMHEPYVGQIRRMER